MHWLLGFVLLLLALGTLRTVGCGDESPCGDCGDGNTCTRDFCDSFPRGGYCDPDELVYHCAHESLPDGSSCDANGAVGLCLEEECVEFDGTFPCTEQGVRLAIALGGGPHAVDCDRPTSVVTQAEIELDKDVILDGGGNLSIDGGKTHRVFSVAAGVTAELRGMTVTGGGAEQLGGGIGIMSRGTLTLINSTVSGNTAFYGGGGIHNEGTLTLTNSTVSGNLGDFAGGIHNQGTAMLTNSTVSGNEAAEEGGGIYNSGTLTLTNSTVSGNEAAEGGGIFNASRKAVVTLINSTISGGSAVTSSYSATTAFQGTVVDGGCVVEGYAPTTSTGHNIESPGNTCGFDQATDQVDVTAAELNLGPLQDNGGPTETHALGAGSVAIDQILAEDCVDAEGEPLTTDQRGQPRDSMCDVGAFEVQP